MSERSDDAPLRSHQSPPRKREQDQVEYLGLDGRARRLDLGEVLAAAQVWYGHESVAPHEILIRTPGDRCVLIVSIPLGLSEDGSGSPTPRELSRQQAAEWLILNRVEPFPEGLPRIDLMATNEPPGSASRRQETLTLQCDPLARDRNLPSELCPTGLDDRIRRCWPRRKLQAELVKYMADRESASYLEVANGVHGDDATGGDAIEKLVGRTNESLVALDTPVRFRCGGEHVYRESIPD